MPPMRIIQLGRRWINLEYLICAEPIDATAEGQPAAFRVILESGIVRDLGPDEAETLKRHLAELTQARPDATATQAVPVREISRRRRPPSAVG